MENETKKEYVAPEMSIIEIEHQANLLQCSDSTDPQCGYGGSLG